MSNQSTFGKERHYRWLADYMYDQLQEATRIIGPGANYVYPFVKHMAHAIAAELSNDNPNFDISLFLTNCGISVTCTWTSDLNPAQAPDLKLETANDHDDQ